MLQRAQELFVQRMCLFITGLPGAKLILELRALLVRVGELAERGDEFHTADDEVEVLRKAGVVAVGPGER